VTPTLQFLSFSNGNAQSSTPNGKGGNIYAENSELRFIATPVMSGTATQGGGLYLKNCRAAFDISSLDTGSLLDTVNLLRVQNNLAAYGGGLYVDGGSPTLTGLAVYSNTATSDGGGLYLNGGQPVLVGGLVLENRANGLGGGLYLKNSAARIAATHILSNTAATGAGLYLDGPFSFSPATVPIIANNYIRHNRVTGSQGGGLYFKQAIAGLVNNVIADNHASDGAAMYLWASSPQLFHTTIATNTGNSGIYLTHKPGVVWPPVIPIPSQPTFTNTIIVSHTTGIYVASTGWGSYQNAAELDGTLWWNNSPDFAGPGAVIHSTDLYTLPHFTCTGNSLDCLQPYHLLTDSAAVDAGVDVALALVGDDLFVDIDGQLRPSGPKYDLGADEVVSEPFSVWLMPPVSRLEAEPGQTVTHEHRLMNTGLQTDTYTLTHSSDTGWATLIASPTITLGPQTSQTLWLQVVVPPTAGNVTDTTIITATSWADPRNRRAFAWDSTKIVTATPGAYNPNELSYGLYWFGRDNAHQKFISGTVNPYYDPAKPTLIFAHGWQPGISAIYPPTFIYQHSVTASVDTAAAWLDDGWNVGIFFWNQFSDEPEDVRYAEAKIWTPAGPQRMRWKDGYGNYHEAPTGTVSAGELFYNTYVEALSGYTGPEIRVAGHSLGNQMAVRLTQLVSDSIAAGTVPTRLMPTRVALLDPYWSIEPKDYLSNKTTGETIRGYVADILAARDALFEWYWSSPLTVEPFGYTNSPLKPMMLFAEMQPGDSFAPDPMSKHCAAYHLYFWAYAFDRSPDCNGDGCLNMNRLLSRMTNNQLRAVMRPDYVWVQDGGQATATPKDDTFTSTLRYAWTGNVDTSWHTAANWTSGVVPGATSNVIIPDAATHWPAITGWAQSNNLTIEKSARLTVTTGATLTVQNQVANNGRLTLLAAVNTPGKEFHLRNDANAVKYYGVVITPTANNLGTVAVTLRGNQTCGAAGQSQTVKRCYDIRPEYNFSATVRFYYHSTEANGNTDPAVYHHVGNGVWQPLTTTARFTNTTEWRWVEAQVAGFSLFALQDAALGAPTAVALNGLYAHNGPLAAGIITGIIILAAWVALRRRRV
jgi:hypothetical protein